jgi:hypothetical protein
MRTKLLAAALLFAAAAPAGAAELTKGTPELKSATALAFGPNGLLFVGDPLGATVYAIDTGDAKSAGNKDLNVEKIDEKVAATLGVTAKEIRIGDVKVNPASGNVYLAVTRGTGAGQPALLRVTRGGAVEAVSLKDVPFAKVEIPNPFDPKPKARGTRADTITGMAFIDGRLFIAGLSSEEFASTLRVIPYPFKDTDKGAGIEIYHGAHGKVETHAPIKAFTPYKIGKEDHIMASYTCTPLVKIPVSELKAGAKVKGTTIAELGNQNQPIDMISYTKGGKDYLLSSNSRHGVIKIPTADFASAEPISTRIAETAGVKYEKITDLKDVTQLDKLDDTRAVILTGKAGAGFDLKTIPLP